MPGTGVFVDVGTMIGIVGCGIEMGIPPEVTPGSGGMINDCGEAGMGGGTERVGGGGMGR